MNRSRVALLSRALTLGALTLGACDAHQSASATSPNASEAAHSGQKRATPGDPSAARTPSSESAPPKQFTLPGVASCLEYQAGQVTGNLPKGPLEEVSGIVASRRNPGVLFVQNDSGDAPRFFALSEKAEPLGEFVLSGANFKDCEDIGFGEGFVLLGDTGDNAARNAKGKPRDFVSVYRVPEPLVNANGNAAAETITDYDVIDLVYPDHPHDAEALFFDPVERVLVIVSKEDTGPSGVFTAKLPPKAQGKRPKVAPRVTLERIQEIPFGTERAPGNKNATAADISPSGDAILIRTYTSVLLWPRPKGTSLKDALGKTAWVMPSRLELQGEAVCFGPSGRGYFSLSEHAQQPLTFFAPDPGCPSSSLPNPAAASE
jgi:hypothetical protein